MKNIVEESGVSAPALEFTVDWFSQHIPNWERLIPVLPARKKFLEIGSFEGRSACWMLENMLDDDGELICIDTWAGSPEFYELPDGIVGGSFDRFRANTAIAKRKTQSLRFIKNESVLALSALIAKEYFHVATFDFIYIDGGHRAFETLTDAVMSWPLLKKGGIMVFDDYLWSLHAPVSDRPKAGIDAFVELFHSQLQTIAVGGQYVLRKTA